MASIVVLTGEHDAFHARQFMVQQLFPHWIDAGHFVVVHEGPAEPPAADVAILHVDLTVVPPDYMRWLDRYPVVVNGATGSIGKRSYSRQIVTLGDGYEGPVIVKTDANCGGLPEAHWAEREKRLGRKTGERVHCIPDRYPIFASPSLVPPHLWSDPQMVVERFLPEREGEAFALRAYVFFGDRERCNRVVGPHPVVKASDATSRVPVPIPEEIREHRHRLGFDYGKIDFVLHRGEPVLLDANRTPTMPSGNLSEAVLAGMRELARGIESFVPRGRAPSS